MEANFWKTAWATGRIGFHQGRPNEYLVEHAARLSGRVLVPMCGKTDDLSYLASRGHRVIGVELVEDAVAAFFAEQFGNRPSTADRSASIAGPSSM